MKFLSGRTLMMAMALVVVVVVFVLLDGRLQFSSPVFPAPPQPLAARNPASDLNVSSNELTSSISASNEVASDLSASNDKVTSQCHDVLHNMMSGTWQPRHLTPDDRKRMRKFQERVEKDHNLPRANERSDKKCGNVRAGRSVWFKALCDPEGPTPCCYHNVCRNKTLKQCACSNCVDMRNTIHAEYATWRPCNRSCQPRQWSVSAICHLLHNSSLLFIGASFVRHVYTALLLAVRGDSHTGAFRKDVSEEQRSECSGLNMFSEKACRHLLDRKPMPLCNGSFIVKFQLLGTGQAERVQNAVLSLSNRSRSLVFMSVGTHDHLNSERAQAIVMRPLLDTMRARNLTSPRILWAGVHHYGVRKMENVLDQNPRAKVFNRSMRNFLAGYGVPFFDTDNLTRTVDSFDGSHYGYGVNAMKVNILLHYIEELRSLGQW